MSDKAKSVLFTVLFNSIVISGFNLFDMLNVLSESQYFSGLLICITVVILSAGFLYETFFERTPNFIK